MVPREGPGMGGRWIQQRLWPLDSLAVPQEERGERKGSWEQVGLGTQRSWQGPCTVPCFRQHSHAPPHCSREAAVEGDRVLFEK